MLQKEIQAYHFANRKKVKDIEEKYEVETRYKNTGQLIEGKVEERERYLKGGFEIVSQDQLEDSLIRLDELLRKQEKKLGYLK